MNLTLERRMRVGSHASLMLHKSFCWILACIVCTWCQSREVLCKGQVWIGKSCTSSSIHVGLQSPKISIIVTRWSTCNPPSFFLFANLQESWNGDNHWSNETACGWYYIFPSNWRQICPNLDNFIPSLWFLRMLMEISSMTRNK